MPDMLSSDRHSVPKLWPIALLRIYTGVFFAWHGLNKLRGDKFSENLANFVSTREEQSFGFYRGFAENVVVPNAELFATLVTWGELLVGLALIVGLATRYAAVAGAVMMANFWFVKGQGFLAGQNHDVVWLMIFIVLALIPAGRIAGLDDGLSDRFRFLR